MRNSPATHLDISERTTAEFEQEFQSILHTITQMKGITFAIATDNQNIARMQHGKSRIFFNPKFTYTYITQLVQEQGSTFVLDKGHILQILVHEIGHMVEYGQLMADQKTYQILPKPRFTKLTSTSASIAKLREDLLITYGEKWRYFENIIRDIRVDKWSADMKQTNTLTPYMRDNYLERTVPQTDLRYAVLQDGTKKANPLQDQFARAIMKGQVTWVRPIVDDLVQDYIENNHILISQASNVRNNTQLNTLPMRYPAMIKLFDCYLELEEQDKKNEEKEKKQEKKNDWNTSGQWTEWTPTEWAPQGGNKTQGDGKNGSEEKEQAPAPSEWEQWTWTDSPSGKQPEGQEKDSDKAKDKGREKNEGNTGTPRTIPHLLEQSGINLDPQAGTIPSPSGGGLGWGNSPLGKGGGTNEVSDGGLEQPTPEDLQSLLAQLTRNATPKSEKDQKLEQAFNQTFDLKADDPLLEQKKEELVDWANEHFDTKHKTFDKTKEFLLQQLDDRAQMKNILESLTDSQGRNIMNFITKYILSRIQSLKKAKQTEYSGPVKREKSNGSIYTDEIVNVLIDNHDGDPLIRNKNTHREIEKKELNGFEFDLIADGSWSMTEWTKNYDQRVNSLLVGYALSKLQEEIDYAHIPGIEVFSSASLFSWWTVHTLRKRNSKLTTKELLVANHKLKIASSTTGDFVAMQKYTKHLQDAVVHDHTAEEHTRYLEQIASGRRKKILLLMSDGGSDDTKKMKQEIKKARDLGIITCGLGITASGSPIIDLFGAKQEDPQANALGYGEVCDTPSQLGQHIQELLIAHLEASV
jgi:hypothetical protein